MMMFLLRFCLKLAGFSADSCIFAVIIGNCGFILLRHAGEVSALLQM